MCGVTMTADHAVITNEAPCVPAPARADGRARTSFTVASALLLCRALPWEPLRVSSNRVDEPRQGAVRKMLNRGPWCGMKGLAILGIVLLLGGLAALIWPAITVTHREKAVDLGPIEVTTEDRDTIPLPPVFGIAAAAAGVVLIAMSRRRA